MSTRTTVFDHWAERWRRREVSGDMIIVRYADDIIIGFEHETLCPDAMRERLGEYSLSALSGQDPPDRVWPLRGGSTRPAGLGRIPRRTITSRALRAEAKNPLRPHAGEPRNSNQTASGKPGEVQSQNRANG